MGYIQGSTIVYIASQHSIHNGEVLILQFVHLWKAIKNFEVKVDVHKGPLNFREFVDNRCASFIKSMFSFIVVIW